MAGSLEAIQYCRGKLKIVDQLLLPHDVHYIDVRDTQDGWRVIRDMQVRGAPAIAVVGVLSLVAEIYESSFTSVTDFSEHVKKQLDYLVTARPTAVNMADARDKLLRQLRDWTRDTSLSADDVKRRLIACGEQMLADDVATNKSLARHGADDIESRCQTAAGRLKILTHCNTGSLATAGYGTALGVVRTLYSRGRLERCYYTETRPYNQGARLTAFELVHDAIPSTLICDDMVAAAMSRHGIDAVVTGADRVAANGDTANKVGTFQIAVVAKHHDVPFYVAAPSTSVDLSISSGHDIEIEQRPSIEMTCIAGVPITANGVECWNPAFDVTPAALITGGIVTEFGVYRPHELKDALTSAAGNHTPL